jgi:hypothetical protein
MNDGKNSYTKTERVESTRVEQIIKRLTYILLDDDSTQTHTEQEFDYMFGITTVSPISSGGSKLRKSRRNKTRKSRKNRRKSVRRVSKNI